VQSFVTAGNNLMSTPRLEGASRSSPVAPAASAARPARRFAEEGADLVLADLNPERGAEAKREIETSFNRRAVFVTADVAREEDIDTLVRRAVEEFGRIDCVLAAAGVSNAHYVSGEVRARSEDPTANYLINKPVADWERVLKINLTGVMLTDRAVARHMIEAGIKGSIINIASVAARVRCGRGRLQRVESRRRDADEGARNGAGRTRHPRQRDRSRLHRERDDARHAQRSGGTSDDDGDGRRWVGSASRSRSPHRRLSRERRVVVLHRTDLVPERRHDGLTTRWNVPDVNSAARA
jgi:NAD(P)-dependent dehydrogenase (short-subunit alcohol dehydrogenase family)